MKGSYGVVAGNSRVNLAYRKDRLNDSYLQERELAMIRRCIPVPELGSGSLSDNGE